MKALVKYALGKGNLELRDLPDPVPGPGEVVMRVAATGVCGTDLHVEDDEYVVVPPVTIGHETSGRVVATGPGVTSIAIGDRVTAMTTMWSCGTCDACHAGELNRCPERHGLGAQPSVNVGKRAFRSLWHRTWFAICRPVQRGNIGLFQNVPDAFVSRRKIWRFR